LRNDSTGMSNGSLFSYIYLAERKGAVEYILEPTKMNAFRGTFYLTSAMLNFSVMVLMLELGGWKFLSELCINTGPVCKYYCTRVCHKCAMGIAKCLETYV